MPYPHGQNPLSFRHRHPAGRPGSHALPDGDRELVAVAEAQSPRQMTHSPAQKTARTQQKKIGPKMGEIEQARSEFDVLILDGRLPSSG
jgi:hypothetical protein